MYQEDLLHRIRTYLSRFESEVCIDNNNGEFSINNHAENILIPILNTAYGFDLHSANIEYGIIYPGIDLIDEQRKTAFQITSTCDYKKVAHTLDICRKYGLDQRYDYLYFYFLKGNSSAININSPGLKNRTGQFKTENIHFLDHSLFYKRLKEMNNIEILQKVHDLLESQFSDREGSQLMKSDNNDEQLRCEKLFKEATGTFPNSQIIYRNTNEVIVTKGANSKSGGAVSKRPNSTEPEEAQTKPQLDEIKKRNMMESLSAQSNIFHIGGTVSKFIPIISSWNYGEDEYYYGDITTEEDDYAYTLPEEILELFIARTSSSKQKGIFANTQEKKVRINDYSVRILGGRRPHQLKFNFSSMFYRDYLIVREVIDEVLIGTSSTVRAKYFNHKGALISKELPNICGVGIFIITSDNKILISKASKNVAVNPNKYIYSASGTMDWHDRYTNPFLDIIRETEEEIGYRPNIEELKLYSVGIDYETAYYQFSFYEKSGFTASQILENALMARDFYIEIENLIPLDFRIDTIIDFINNNNWDETAKANLLTLLVKFNTKSDVEKYINPNKKKQDYRNHITKEWERRASREGRFAVLSNRYPSNSINEISEDYCSHVKQFIDEDLEKCKVLEIGGGIGLFTKYFAENAIEVTCIDVAEKMIERNKQYLGAKLAEKVQYVNAFFQDYHTADFYDILVCSLVLIHNAPELSEFIENMKRYSDTIYLFEHVENGAHVSIFTEPKTADEYISYFKEYYVEKRETHFLGVDTIAFIKLKRKLRRR